MKIYDPTIGELLAFLAGMATVAIPMIAFIVLWAYRSYRRECDKRGGNISMSSEK